MYGSSASQWYPQYDLTCPFMHPFRLAMVVDILPFSPRAENVLGAVSLFHMRLRGECRQRCTLEFFLTCDFWCGDHGGCGTCIWISYPKMDKAWGVLAQWCDHTFVHFFIDGMVHSLDLGIPAFFFFGPSCFTLFFSS